MGFLVTERNLWHFSDSIPAVTEYLSLCTFYDRIYKQS